MTDETKTPLEIAREVWPIKWEDWSTSEEPHFKGYIAEWRVDIYNGEDDESGWFVYTHGERTRHTDLRAAIAQVRDATLAKLHEAVALCEPATTTALDLTPHIDRPKGAVWALHGLGQPVRFGPPGAVNAEVHLPALAELGSEDVEQVREVILRHLCDSRRVPWELEQHKRALMWAWAEAKQEGLTLPWDEPGWPAVIEAWRVEAEHQRLRVKVWKGERAHPLDRPPDHVDPLPSRAAMPEPAPEAGEGDVWAEIIDRLEDGPLKNACIARRAMGIEKYGQPLQRGDGRDHAIDEAQEHLDAAAYRAARAGAEDPAVMASLHRAAECLGIEEVYPVPVAFHPNGEAMLMLTDAHLDTPVCIAVSRVLQVVKGSKSKTTCVHTGRNHFVRESAADIRRTLEMLAATPPPGGQQQ